MSRESEWIAYVGPISFPRCQPGYNIIVARGDHGPRTATELGFAHAGLPTKFVESLANATRAIANLTSDLGEYLHDGAEGLVSADHSAGPAATRCTVRRNPPLRNSRNMRHAAQAHVLRSFDFRRHAQPLLEDVRG
jgi:hypothetical protein